MNSSKKGFFRIYIPAFIISYVSAYLIEQLFQHIDIKNNLGNEIPPILANILHYSFYFIMLFSIYILGCFFSDSLPIKLNKMNINVKLDSINNNLYLLKRCLVFLTIISILIIIYQGFKDILISSIETNYSIGDTLESIVSGIFLATLFFFLKEKIFGYPDLNGIWYLQSTTQKSDFNPYLGMELQHQLFLVQDKSSIKGTAEQYYEDSSIGKGDDHILHPDPKNRRRSLVEGTIQKNYFSADILILHILEKGEQRQSTILCRIKLKRHFLIGKYIFNKIGNFSSVVSNQKGIVILQKEKFYTKPAKVSPKFQAKP